MEDFLTRATEDWPGRQTIVSLKQNTSLLIILHIGKSLKTQHSFIIYSLLIIHIFDI